MYCFYALDIYTPTFKFYKKLFSSNSSISKLNCTWEIYEETQKCRSITKTYPAHFSHFTVSVDIINWNCWLLFIVLVCSIQPLSPNWSCSWRNRFQCFNGVQWDVTGYWSAWITKNKRWEWIRLYATDPNTIKISLKWQHYNVWWIVSI